MTKGLTLMAAQQQWSIARENASIVGGTQRKHEAIATSARNGASIAVGTPQKHKAILDCKQARENAIISR
jgi:hypothetical protein